MLLYEYYDIIFFFKCLKSPSSSFNINNYVSFASSSTRFANSKLLHTKSTTNSSRHFYFNRLPRLWNSLPVLSMEQYFKSLKQNLKIILWNYMNMYFITHFDPDSPCSVHFVCPCRSCTPLSLHHNFTQAV